MRYLYLLLLLFFISCSTNSTPVYQLSTSTEPNTAGSIQPNNGEFEEGEQIEIHAVANETWVFEKWEGDLTGNLNPAPVIMNRDKLINAIFKKRNYALEINIEGNGVVQETIIQSKSTNYPEGSVIKLEAVPDEGWEFIEWEGDFQSNENPYSIRISDNTITTAIFKKGVFDGDGNFYNSIKIGEQTWTVENLRTTKFSNGEQIPNVTNYNSWVDLTSPAWIYFNNDASHEDVYGKLYNWWAVTDSRDICPDGWRIPTYEDWFNLEDYLAGPGEEYSKVGGMLKATGIEFWNSPNVGATNETGFKGLPGGYVYDQSYSMAVFGTWWTNYGFDDGYGSAFYLSYDSSELNYYEPHKSQGLSIRCIKRINSSEKDLVPKKLNKNKNKFPLGN